MISKLNNLQILPLSEDEKEQTFGQLEKIVRRAKSDGNTSCYIFHIGDEDFTIRGGQKVSILSYCIFLKSGDVHMLLDENTQSEDLWIFIDLKRQRYYVVSESKFIDVDFLCVLQAHKAESSQFTNGFYCYENNCTLIYDADCANSMFDLISNYHKTVATQKNTVQKNTDVEEDYHNEF